MASAAVGLCNGILLARLLGGVGYSVYVLACSTGLLMATVASLGLPSLVTRYVSKYKLENESPAINGIVWWANRLVLKSTVTILLLGLFAAGVAYSLGSGVTEYVVAFLLVPAIAFGSVRSAVLRGGKLLLLSELPDTLLRPLFLLVALLSVWGTYGKLSPVTGVVLHVVSAYVAFCVGLAFLAFSYRDIVSGVVERMHYSEWWSELAPFTLNSSVQMLKNRTITFILGGFGSEDSVAVYDVALRISSLATYVLDAINLAISPYISTSYQAGDLGRLKSIIRSAGRIVLFVSLLVTVVVVVGGLFGISVSFGDEYESAYMPLCILCVGQLVSCVFGSVGLLLNMTGNQRVFSRSNLFALGGLALLSLILITLLDVVGAALAFVIVITLQNYFLWRKVRELLDVNTVVFL